MQDASGLTVCLVDHAGQEIPERQLDDNVLVEVARGQGFFLRLEAARPCILRVVVDARCVVCGPSLCDQMFVLGDGCRTVTLTGWQVGPATPARPFVFRYGGSIVIQVFEEGTLPSSQLGLLTFRRGHVDPMFALRERRWTTAGFERRHDRSPDLAKTRRLQMIYRQQPSRQ